MRTHYSQVTCDARTVPGEPSGLRSRITFLRYCVTMEWPPGRCNKNMRTVAVLCETERCVALLGFAVGPARGPPGRLYNKEESVQGDTQEDEEEAKEEEEESQQQPAICANRSDICRAQTHSGAPPGCD